MRKNSVRKKVFADYASATPIEKEVKKALKPLIDGTLLGNPSSIHSLGRASKELLETSRQTIASLLQVKSDEVVFTSGGTESNNLAIFGVVRSSPSRSPHVITTKIEHSSVLEPIRSLEKEGVSVTYLSVGRNGQVNMKEFEKALRRETVLVSIAYANGEIGTIENIRTLGITVDAYRKSQPIFFHTDASQAANFLRILPNDLRVGLLTLDSSKIYGPSGAGMLYIKRGTPLRPILFGGLQERGMRPGTENLLGAIGLSISLSKAQSIREKESKRLVLLRDLLREKLCTAFPKALLNGGEEALPNFLNICIPGVDAEFLSVQLDHEGILVSSASACRSISGSGSSYVIEALPNRGGCGRQSLRITLGRSTTKSDVLRIASAIERLVKA